MSTCISLIVFLKIRSCIKIRCLIITANNINEDITLVTYSKRVRARGTLNFWSKACLSSSWRDEVVLRMYTVVEDWWSLFFVSRFVMKIPGILHFFSFFFFFIEKEDVETCREFYSNSVNEFVNDEDSRIVFAWIGEFKPDAIRLRTATWKIFSSPERSACLIYKN